MTGLVRRATLLTGLGLLAAGAAVAGVPNLGNSTVGNNILLGGQSGGVVDVRVEKSITIRDAGNNPVPNSVVSINFTACTAADFRLCAAQPHAIGGVTFVNCASKVVSRVTDAAGVVLFRVVGGAVNVGFNTAGLAAVVGPGGCATLSADGVPLGNLKVSAPNENGGLDALGIDLLDTLAYLNDRGDGDQEQRSDFNGDGIVDLLDTLIYLPIRGGGGSATGCAGGNCL